MTKIIDIDSDDYLDSLDEYERDIEENLDKMKPNKNMKEEMAQLKAAAAEYLSSKKSITIRVHEADLESIKVRASKLGVPYQTYINILIHRGAVKGLYEI